MGKELGTGDQRDLLPITVLQFLGSKEMARLSSSAALSSQQRILETRVGQRQGQQAGSKRVCTSGWVGSTSHKLWTPAPKPKDP